MRRKIQNGAKPIQTLLLFSRYQCRQAPRADICCLFSCWISSRCRHAELVGTNTDQLVASSNITNIRQVTDVTMAASWRLVLRPSDIQSSLHCRELCTVQSAVRHGLVKLSVYMPAPQRSPCAYTCHALDASSEVRIYTSLAHAHWLCRYRRICISPIVFVNCCHLLPSARPQPTTNRSDL